jgi:serine protease Do
MGSRTGTYVNTQRVSGRVKLMPGDIVQLGPGGPEFEFDVDPPPEGMPRSTRPATEISPQQRPIATPRAATPSRTPPPGGVSGKPSIGKAAVEQMIQEGRHRSRKNLYFAAAIVVVLLGTATVFWARGCEAAKPKSLGPSEISARNLDAVVEVEFGWKLIDSGSGRQLNQLYFPNVKVVRPAKPIIPDGPDYLPMFVTAGDGIEPLLTTETGGGHNRPIGEAGMQGSGFVVSSDGFILTNRHVAASWNTQYTFPDSKGVLLTSEGGKLVVKPIEAPGGWVPADAKVLTHVNSPDPAKLEGIDRYPAGKGLEGRNDYLDVTFARTGIRVPAKLARVSDHIDVAMIKVDIPRALRKCDLNDNYETIKPGGSITVMGYPALSPNPSIATGNIARVTLTEPLRSNGDVYQLTTTATGDGYSGGPVFDSQGRVVGLFSSERHDHSKTKIIFAVPIRYGMELMGLTKEM